MTILVIGAQGRLGACLSRALTQAGHHVMPFDRKSLDLSAPEQIESILSPLTYDLVIICAAATNLDWCEQNPTASHLINVTSPEKIAQISHQKNARVLFFSTDYVYDGREPGLKSETAPLNPISVYAQTKLNAENAISTVTAHQALILRISWLFGPDRPAFPEYVINLAREGKPLSIIADKFSSPTYAPDVASCLTHLISDHYLPTGIYNLANTGVLSWCEFAEHILKSAATLNLCPRNYQLSPVSMQSMHHFIAARPIHTAMATEKISTLYPMRAWPDALAEHLTHLQSRSSLITPA